MMEPSSACSYVATQRGGVALLFEGHRYNKVRDGKDGTVYWRCSRDRQCPGRAVTVNNRVKKSNNKHNHPPEASLLMRNCAGGNNHHQQQHHQTHHSNANNSAMAMAAAAAYAQLLQQQGSNNHFNKTNTNKSSLNHSSINSVATSRPQPHTSPSTASPSLSPSPQSNFNMPAGMSPSGAGSSNSFNPFSLLHNLTAAAAAAQSTSPGHLANFASNIFDNGRHIPTTALNLSANNYHNAGEHRESSPGGGHHRHPFNHLSNLSLMTNNLNNRDSKISIPNSPPPTPTCNSPGGGNGNNNTNNNSLLFAKSLQQQYNTLLKTQFNNNNNNNRQNESNTTNINGNANIRSNITNNNGNCNFPNTLDLSPRSMFPFGGNSHQFPLSLLASGGGMGKNEFPSPVSTPTHQQQQPSSPKQNDGNNLAAAFMIQDAIQEAQAAAAAAAVLPSFLSDTFKYLAAAAATNPQMAAALASTLSSQGMLKNFDLTIATAAATAVAAAANNSNNNNSGSGSSVGSRSCNSSTNGNTLDTSTLNKLHNRSDSFDHSPLGMLHDIAEGNLGSCGRTDKKCTSQMNPSGCLYFRFP